MGGMLAYELARTIQEEGCGILKVSQLIVSAVITPTDLTSDNKTTPLCCQMSEKDLASYLMGKGLRAGVDLDWLNLMIPSIKKDYCIFESYDEDLCEHPSTILDCPLTTLAGSDDIPVSCTTTPP